MSGVRVVHGVGERVPVAELGLVPDEVDVVVLLADGPGRPGAPAGPPDEVQAGVDAVHVVVQVGAADRPGADVLVGELGGRAVARGEHEPLDQAGVVGHVNR